jgi:hypothetical protein
MQNAVADVVLFPDDLAGLFVDGDDGGGFGRRDVDVALVLAVGGAEVEHVSPGHDR